MGLATKFADWYKRLRHGRGFGIHSPAAYAMVRDVLNLPGGYMYYREADIPSRHPRMLFRILVHLHPESVAIAGDTPDFLAKDIVAAALPAARIVPLGQPADMAIVGGRAAIDPANYRHIYFNDSKNPAVAAAISALRHGHVYRNPRRTLIVTNPKLPRQIFDVRF